MTRLDRSTALLVVVVAAFVLLPAPARAQDHGAPAGAGHRWLPCEDWVMMHWVPFEERRLYEELRLERSDVLRWLRDDRRHDLGQLARRRGIDTGDLAARLVEGRGSPHTGAAELRERSSMTSLTSAEESQ